MVFEPTGRAHAAIVITEVASVALWHDLYGSNTNAQSGTSRLEEMNNAISIAMMLIVSDSSSC